jgi:hypothetical protein
VVTVPDARTHPHSHQPDDETADRCARARIALGVAFAVASWCGGVATFGGTCKVTFHDIDKAVHGQSRRRDERAASRTGSIGWCRWRTAAAFVKSSREFAES